MRLFPCLSRTALLSTLCLIAALSFVPVSVRAEVWGKLFVQTDPPNAQIRFLKFNYEYQPGIILKDGDYDVEVSSPGYQSVTQNVRVVGGQTSTVYVSLPQQTSSAAAPAMTQTVDNSQQQDSSDIWGKLYINTDPPGASIRFVTISYKYKPGIILRKGTYLVEVSHPGFPSIQKELTVVPGIDNRFLLRMNDPVEKAEAMQIPTTGITDNPGRLIVITDPPGVPVRFLNTDLRYTPGMPLQPGHYQVEVSDTAGRRVVKEVDITAGRETRILASLAASGSDSPQPDASQPLQKFVIPASQSPETDFAPSEPPVPAEPQNGQLVIYTSPADATVRLDDGDISYQPGMTLPQGSYKVEVSKDGFDTHSQRVNVVGDKIQQLHVRLEQQATSSSLPASLKKYAIGAPRKASKRTETPKKAAEGALKLNLDPADSSVFFLNTNTPYSPGVRLPAGSYQVKIRRPGYESVTVQVEIKAGKELEAQISLRPDLSAQPSLPVQAAAPAAAPSAPQNNAGLSAQVPPLPGADGDVMVPELTPEQQLVQEGNYLLDNGDNQTAFQRFNEALKMDPKMSDAFKGRGFVYYKLGKYKHAIKEYEKCLSLAPDDAEAYYERGNAYLAAGSKKRALEDYDKSITLNPKFPDAYNARGTVHFASRQYLNALEDYTRALNIDATYADAYYNRATTHMKLGMYELAVKDYDALLQIDPYDKSARQKRDEASKKMGK